MKAKNERKPLPVTYESRCAGGCGKVMGTITFDDGRERPEDINRRFLCSEDCGKPKAPRPVPKDHPDVVKLATTPSKEMNPVTA